MHENELLDNLRHLFASSDSSVLTGSGPDDCAHLALDSRRLAVSTDAFAEGSHFLPDAPPRDVGRKALAASLSDLAASACRPRWALVSLCLRRGVGAEWAGEFARGVAETAREYGVSIVGGDTVSAPGGTFVSVTVIGVPLPGGPVLRSGGRAGDVLAVTGTLGGSLSGRHLRPEPRLREIAWLMDFCVARAGGACPTALMDLSDGLGLDLSRLCRESGVGAIVDAAAVPVSDAAKAAAARSGKTALEHALGDGEDFELLIAVPSATWRALSTSTEYPAELARFVAVGELRSEPGVMLRFPDGTMKNMAAEGFEHQW